MPYIGRDTDKLSNIEVLDNITFDGSSSYTLQKGGSNFTPSSANTLLLSIDGVVQAGNFTVSGSTINFGTAVAGTSTCDFILHYGIGLITTPSDGTVTTAKLADSSVSLAKLTATGTKDSTTFLRGDNTFAAAGLNGWSEDGANNNLLPASASAGIYLGVNSATASNLLDDYEEGTWTPNFGAQTGSFGSLTFSLAGQNGAYTKVGNKVTAWCRANCTTTNIGTASGQFQITGLPFASNSIQAMFAGSAWRGGGSGPTTVSILMVANVTYVSPVKTDGTTVQVSDLASGGRNDFTVTITYETA
jgi:hypothetical protein